MPVIRTGAALAGVLLIVGIVRTAHAAPPNRVYGTVTLNGTPAPVGTAIVALTGGKVCGTTTVTATAISGNSYPYVLNLPDPSAPPECKPGAVITFTVAGLPAGQTITLDDLGTFFRVDLVAPGTPSTPGAGGRIVTLAPGCTDVLSAFPDGTAAAVVAAAVTPAEVLQAIWRYDAAAGRYAGFSPTASFASDLTRINRSDTIRICTGAPATLTQPE
ncbi:MAG: hypothetical protein C4290_07600 [Chloroflexota bacterium]